MAKEILEITNIQTFLEEYFSAKNCEITHNKDGVMNIQLTEEMDKALMNRPFYWHYIKSTGHDGDPMKLVLITNPDKRDEKGEWIHYGSPRLQQIFKHLKEETHNIKLFQDIETSDNTPLYPWLLINIKISYHGKQNKNEIFSIGLNLVNGNMNTEMMQLLDEIPLRKTISNYCYTISPLIKIESGFKRIENILDDYLTRQNYDWANESIQTLKEETLLVEHFYEHIDDSEKLTNEIKDLSKRFTPSISYSVINGGIVYLRQEPN